MEDRRKPQNEPCSLLTGEENDKLFSIIGSKCISLAAAVVQVFLTESPRHSHWVKKYCGVACFSKDYVRKSYFIKIIDFDKQSCIWEQEIYNQFTYKCPYPFFHSFEAESCMAGLNFAETDEANVFKAAVLKMLKNRQQRRQEKRRNQVTHPTNAGIIVAAQARSESMPSLIPKEKSGPTKGKPKKLTKEDIGAPSDFRHMQHVGWNPVTGFEMTNIDEDLKGFFSLAGVSDKDLNDNETRTFIYDFIENHGGIEKAKQEVLTMRAVPPPPPVREAPPTPRNPRGSPSLRSAAPPPPLPPSVSPIPSRQHSATINQGRSATAAIPPPPTRGPPPPRPPPAMSDCHTTPTPPPPPPPPPPLAVNCGAPPPPPPPLPSGLGGGKAPPPALPPSDAPPDTRSALFDQIRKGKALHHVEVNGNASNSNNSDDARGALLSQIRMGIELKPVTEESRASSAAPMQGLAGALAKALQERSRVIQETDESESDDDEDNYDDWED